MTKLALACSFLALCATLPAQGGDAPAPEKKTEKKSVVMKKVVVSRNGETDEKVVRRVTENGKVVEESGKLGDLDLPGLEGLDLDELVRDAVEASGDGKGYRVTRRIVIKNGKRVVDEETRDGEPMPGGVDVDDLLDDLRRKFPDMPDIEVSGGKGRPVIDVDVDVKADGSGKTAKRRRRVVVRDGKKVEEEEEVDGDPEALRKRLRGIRESMGDLEGLLEDLEDRKRELEKKGEDARKLPGKRIRRTRRLVPEAPARPARDPKTERRRIR